MKAVGLLSVLLLPCLSFAAGKSGKKADASPCGLGPFEPPRLLSTSRNEAARPTGTTRKRLIVRVSYTVTSEGRVTDIRVKKHGTPELDQAATQAVENLAFEPAKKNGKPCSVVLETEFEFKPN